MQVYMKKFLLFSCEERKKEGGAKQTCFMNRTVRVQVGVDLCPIYNRNMSDFSVVQGRSAGRWASNRQHHEEAFRPMSWDSQKTKSKNVAKQGTRWEGSGVRKTRVGVLVSVFATGVFPGEIPWPCWALLSPSVLLYVSFMGFLKGNAITSRSCGRQGPHAVGLCYLRPHVGAGCLCGQGAVSQAST